VSMLSWWQQAGAILTRKCACSRLKIIQDTTRGVGRLLPHAYVELMDDRSQEHFSGGR